MTRLLYWPLQCIGFAYILLVAMFPNTAWPATPTPSPAPTQCVGDYCVPVPAHPTQRCIVDPFTADLGPIACATIAPSPAPPRPQFYYLYFVEYHHDPIRTLVSGPYPTFVLCEAATYGTIPGNGYYDCVYQYPPKEGKP